MTRSEAQTRSELIDQQLAQAGWNVKDATQVVEEFDILTALPEGVAEPRTPYEGHQFSDYVLLGKDRKPLAVIEAKKTSRDAAIGREQAKQYCYNIQKQLGGELPFCFYTNGHATYFWDLENAPPRKVIGFPTRDDLERFAYIRRNRKPLTQEFINTSIAGRDYQIRAIRSVLEGIEQKKRDFLLVMATGTGKTRTCIAMVDALMRAGHAENVPHQMEKMQAFIDFIFHEVWCKAPASGPFDLNLFDANAELREVMDAFYYSDAQGADFFYGHVERIYGLFSVLTATQVHQFQLWYQGNNDLEKVCANDPATHLARYADIAVNHKDLADQLGTFFKGLYSQSLLGLAALRAKIGDIDDHYQTFVSTNEAGKCPFCGIDDIKGTHHSKREAYDHYLPKALYPFNSINFRNLAPACHECNSTYKLSKDPARNPAGRRKAFYPYAAAPQTIDIQMALQHSDIENLKPADVQMQFGPAAIAEEIDTWKDVYGIEERYKAKLCGENDGKYWLEQALGEWSERGHNPAEFLTTLARQTQSRPYADCNFLKRPFLEACGRLAFFENFRSNPHQCS